ncbi:DUF3267 domain-containing protein [Sphingobacterium puteale]|uniref:DUF3267 domain-containing protein n=1 Tax=Sphingobacterium puteale TaxID=2420510 RepID=A0A420VQF2_9SPHI|nr:DUF3267 domain-containing protein [Sphingobacterium puteale]RKO68546.1 DUF3267 domain-containing protein [Sphingobacterium puteale]
MDIASIPGYRKEERFIDLYKANVFALFLFIPVILLYTLPFYLIWGREDGPFVFMIDMLEITSITSVLIGILVVILGIIAHELIHGITWACYTKKGFKSIKFGVLMKMLTPYCHCKEPLLVRQYIVGALMPFIILGIIPAIYAWYSGNVNILLFAIFFTVSAAGDFMIVQLIWREDMRNLVLDHPSEAGCFIYKKDE